MDLEQDLEKWDKELELRLHKFAANAETATDRAKFRMKGTLDRAEAQARSGVAQTIGRTIIELEKIRHAIVEKETQ